MGGKELITEHVELIVVFGIIACVVNWIAASKKFFRLPPFIKETSPGLTFKQVIIVFGIYLGIAIIAIPIAAKMILFIMKSSNSSAATFHLMSWLQFIGIFLADFFPIPFFVGLKIIRR